MRSEGPLLPGIFTPDDIPHAEGSDLLWHGSATDVLHFADGMGIRSSDLDEAMRTYNASIESHTLYKPFDTLEEFVTDPSVRKALATVYNNKRSGRAATWEAARDGITFAPAKHRERSLPDAFRIETERRTSDTLRRTKPR